MTRFFVSLAPFNPPEVSKKIGVCSWYMICSKSQLSHSHISQHQHQLHVHIEQFSQFVFFLHDWNGLVYYSRQVPKWFTKPCRRVFIGTTTGTRSHHQPSPLPRAPPETHQATRPIVIFQGLRRHCISHDLVKLHDLWRERTSIFRLRDLIIIYGFNYNPGYLWHPVWKPDSF